MARVPDIGRQVWRDVGEAAWFTAVLTPAAVTYAMAFLVPAALLRWVGWRQAGWSVDLAVAAIVSATPALLALALLILLWATRFVLAFRRRLTTRCGGPWPRDGSHSS